MNAFDKANIKKTKIRSLGISIKKAKYKEIKSSLEKLTKVYFHIN